MGGPLIHILYFILLLYNIIIIYINIDYRVTAKEFSILVRWNKPTTSERIYYVPKRARYQRRVQVILQSFVAIKSR